MDKILNENISNMQLIPLDLLNEENSLNIRIYIMSGNIPKMVKDIGVHFSKDLKNRLMNLSSSDKNKVLINKDDVKEYINICNSMLLKIINSNDRPKDTFTQVFDILETVYDTLSKNISKESIKEASKSSEYLSKFLESNPKISEVTIATLKKDLNTSIHVNNVQKLVAGFSSFIGIKAKSLSFIINSAFFHDIGKINIPDEILKKSGKLTDDEYKIIKKHTTFGYEILKKNNLPQEAEIAFTHHEFIDGSGYPNQLKGNEISTDSKIVQICDIYEALTGIRSYRNSLVNFTALELMIQDFFNRGKIEKNIFMDFLKFLNYNKIES